MTASFPAATGNERIGGPLGGAMAALVKILILLVAGAFLTLPAALNGFPLIFYDSAGYLSRATAIANYALPATKVEAAGAGHRTLARPPLSHQAARSTPTEARASRIGQRPASAYSQISQNPLFLRPIGYSVLLAPFATRFSFYLLPFAQGVFAAYVIHRLFTGLSIGGLRPFFLSIVALTVLSSLSIQVSYVMPDVLTGMIVIMSFVVVCGWPQRRMLGRAVDLLLLSVLVATHLSFIPIMLALSVAYGTAASLFRRDIRPSSVLFGSIAPLAIAVALLFASNEAIARKAETSESSPLFLLARLIGDGPARDYLRTACPTKHYLLCAELPRLGDHGENSSISDYFLWDPNGAVKRLASPQLLTEAIDIDRQTMVRYPAQVARNLIGNGLRQLAHFQVDDDINAHPTDFMVKAVEDVDGSLSKAYLKSPQARQQAPLRLARILIGAGMLLSFAVIGWVVLRRRSDLTIGSAGFLVIAVTGVAANALATGGLSEVHDRYGNRVIWVIPLAALVLIFDVLRRRDPVASPPMIETDASISRLHSREHSDGAYFVMVSSYCLAGVRRLANRLYALQIGRAHAPHPYW